MGEGRVEQNEGVRITLKYLVEDWGTEKTARDPVSINFSGKTMKDVYDQAVAHLLELEMGASTKIAKGTKVLIGGREIDWMDFVAEASKDQRMS